MELQHWSTPCLLLLVVGVLGQAADGARRPLLLSELPLQVDGESPLFQLPQRLHLRPRRRPPQGGAANLQHLRGGLLHLVKMP